MKNTDITPGTTVKYRKVGTATVREIVSLHGDSWIVAKLDWIKAPKKYRESWLNDAEYWLMVPRDVIA